MNLFISKRISNTLKDVSLGILEYEVDVQASNDELQQLIAQVQDQVAQIETPITQIPTVRDTRQAYKACGKSPSKYRNAAEALLRRIKQHKGIQPINNVIDIQNMMSISTGYSIGSYDMDHLEGDIVLDVAPQESSYEGIGKERVNISNLPALFDDGGAFGTPTSDCVVAMITPETKRVLTVIYSFSQDDLADTLLQYQDVLEAYTNAKHIELSIVDVPE